MAVIKIKKLIKTVCSVGVVFLMVFTTMTYGDSSFDVNMKTMSLRLWISYKSKFINSQGMVIDTYHKISHSEGQGTAMLFAVYSNDQTIFNKVWAWSKNNLKRDDHLFHWKWEILSMPHITDPNNASDGDILIAWALIRAYWKWGDTEYKDEAIKILNAIEDKLIVDYFDQKILLPGEKHFYSEDGTLIFNPSYFIFPAFIDIAEFTNKKEWLELYLQSLLLINKVLTSEQTAMVTDWMELDQTGQIRFAPKREPLFGYDAIRIPLYLSWCGHDNFLTRFEEFWNNHNGWEESPSWINVKTADLSRYKPESGIKAIRGLASKVDQFTLLHRIFSKSLPFKDYYSSSLVFFTLMALDERKMGVCYP